MQNEECKMRIAKILYRQATADHMIDIAQSIVVGDTLADLLAARSLDCAGYLVRMGCGEHALRERHAADVATSAAADILAAARSIVGVES
jgi:histidinol phosphatase-like enzyme